MTIRPRDHVVVAMIGLFKLAKGVLLFVAASGLVHFGPGFAGVLAGWARDVHVDPDGRHLGRALQAIAAINGRRGEVVSAGMFVYAAFFFIEGAGLLLNKRWARYLTVIITSSFIPLEVFELVRRPDALRLAVILVNVAVVYYLASGIRRR